MSTRVHKYLFLTLIIVLIASVLWAAIETLDHGDIVIGPDNNIETPGYITGKKSGVFAYVATAHSATQTTITTAGTYYPIANEFTNVVMENFIFDTDHIEYSGTKTQYFEIDWHATVDGDGNGLTIHIAIKKNETVLESQGMGTYLKFLNEDQAISGTVVAELATDDEIQIVVTSSGNGDKLKFDHFTTSITEFFD